MEQIDEWTKGKEKRGVASCVVRASESGTVGSEWERDGGSHLRHQEETVRIYLTGERKEQLQMRVSE